MTKEEILAKHLKEADDKRDISSLSYAVINKKLRTYLLNAMEEYATQEVNKNLHKPAVIKPLPLDFVEWISGWEEEDIMRSFERYNRGESGNVL